MNFLVWIIMLLLGFFGISALRKSPPPVVTVQVPATTLTKISTDSVLTIQVNDHNYRITYLKDTLITNRETDMEIFIKKYKNIDTDRILVQGNSEYPYKRFKDVKAALTANDIYKFRVVTTGN